MTKKMVRYPPYGASKVGMNGVTAHMQSVENDCIAREEAEGTKTSKTGRIRFNSVAPGLLNTAFSHYTAMGKDPKDGAEVAV
jgi:NAD(P)-dependent dehydrogenase (short-subunit alcohol dehydrogenase family)